MLLPVQNKAIPADESEAARQLAAHVVREKFDGNRGEAAKAIGVAGSTLTEFLDGGRGAGMKILRGLARVTGQSLDAVTGVAPLVERQARPGAADLASLPGYAEARADLDESQLRALRPIPMDVREEAGTVSYAHPPARVTAAILERACEMIIRGREDAWAPPGMDDEDPEDKLPRGVASGRK